MTRRKQRRFCGAFFSFLFLLSLLLRLASLRSAAGFRPTAGAPSGQASLRSAFFSSRLSRCSRCFSIVDGGDREPLLENILQEDDTYEKNRARRSGALRYPAARPVGASVLTLRQPFMGWYPDGSIEKEPRPPDRRGSALPKPNISANGTSQTIFFIGPSVSMSRMTARRGWR